jgi:glucosamine 6-phosphate synthetase-like amidotransferase/phosphosugar isomerase protein
MCGVIGLIYQRPRTDLGRVAADLLKTLEYRGYDSTGAALQGEGTEVTLAKGVGAPSVMVHELGITQLGGQVFCGQVRWATFGAVTDENSQPHVVRCKTALYGAHNGNVTNSDDLKSWLVAEGHAVLSDNDGEMVVHTVEHLFARELEESASASGDARRAAMRRALVAAGERLQGSFAAVIVDPVTKSLWAVKQGSSLYFGVGQDAAGGAFAIASSDLSSVLKLTRVVVPLSEGELVEYDAERFRVHALSSGALLERSPVRSRLRAKDTQLLPAFSTFMDQEISAQEETCRQVIRLFQGGSDAARTLAARLPAVAEADRREVADRVDALRDQVEDARIREQFRALADAPAFQRLAACLPVAEAGHELPPERRVERLFSADAGFFADLFPMARSRDDEHAVHVLDALLEAEEARELATTFEAFGELCLSTIARRGRLYVLSCGSSYHAAKAAALFWNELAEVELWPCLPGEFRGQSSRSLADGDLVMAVSQSGETKDLIDVLNDVIATGLDVRRVALVNNVSSTLAEEKSHLVIPLRCGPETAVPATKSFMNQLLVFYCLALHLGERRLDSISASPEERERRARDLRIRREKLSALPDLIRETFHATDADVEVAAKLLHLRPSIHILATRMTAVAKEGALKIREVVLNHTEGFEASEFKHGPNTILGFNTVLGPREVDAMLKRLGSALVDLAREGEAAGLSADSLGRLLQAATDSVLSPTVTPFALSAAERALFEKLVDRTELVRELSADYPLLYVTGPDPRDVALTVSQINTHKIRGACSVVIAEDHPALRVAAEKAPADNPSYHSVYVPLPRTGDTLLSMFSATVVLQRLALKMSLLKMQYLDRLGIEAHGVHPDVPKNVSKSITVD